MKYFLLTSLCLLSTIAAFAQNEGSVFTATGRGGAVNAYARDYQSIGINPANLGLKHDYKVAFSIAEVGVGLGSQSLTSTQLSKFISSIDENLTSTDRQEFTNAFAQGNSLNMQLDATYFGLAVMVPKIGGFAASFRQRIMTHIGLNRTFSEILFQGKNAPIYQDPTFSDQTAGNEPTLSTVFDGSKLQIAAFNEFNLAYGVQLIDSDVLKLSAGVGYRYIQGLGVLDLQASSGSFTGYNAMSAVFNVNYGNLPTNDPNFNYVSAKGTFPFYKPAGTGHGFDIGIAAEVVGKVKLGLSVTDLGRVKWKNNLLQAQNQPLQIVQSDGIQTFNIFSEAATIIGEGLLSYQSGGEKTVSSPSKLRFGAGFSPTEKVDLGFDFTLPLNEVAGNLPAPFAGIGLGYTPVKFIRLNTGFSSGAGYGWNIPAGVVFDFKIYELGFGTRSLNGFFTDKNPYTSAVFGILRFKLGTAPE
jgi:hypothetical protein